MNHSRRIYSGFYKRYDGELVYVITTARDGDTGEPTVIYTPHTLVHKNKYYTVSKKSFCENVIIDGEERPKYNRQTQMMASPDLVDELESIKLRGPIRRSNSDYSPPAKLRNYQDSSSYYEYARDICKHYKEDFELVRLCITAKKYIGISKDNFAKAYEDVMLVRNSLKTVLKEYGDFFQERFIQNISVRKYAEKHDMNRGSVEHIQHKFFRALSDILYKRDDSESKCRLNFGSKSKRTEDWFDEL